MGYVTDEEYVGELSSCDPHPNLPLIAYQQASETATASSREATKDDGPRAEVIEV